MAGKFLQICSLRSFTKTIAVLVIVLLAVAIYATREIPDDFGDSKEWEFWRNIDFSMCVVSLAFGSVLLYGSITEFRMFIFAWMIWNVILIGFWIVFLARKYNQLEEWEKNFRIAAIVLMALAEIPVFNYFRHLRINDSHPASNFSWVESQSDKVYKNLNERPSFSSIDAMFAKKPGAKNPGFHSNSARNSATSVASEEIKGGRKEENVDKEDGKKIIEKEKVEEKSEGEQEESDVQSQSSFKISATVHTAKPDENMGKEANESSTKTENSEKVEYDASTPDLPMARTNVGMDIADEEKPSKMGTAATGSSVVVEMEDIGMSSHPKSSVAVKIDVTNTSF